MTDQHASEINGRSTEYQQFLETWARHCGAPFSVFQGHLNCLIYAELQMAAQDVIDHVQDLQKRTHPNRKALDRLLTDLLNHLEGHDCFEEGCLALMGVDDLICAGKASLAGRIRQARRVLEFDAVPPAST
jgi:hypothetical protein